jgi:uncharacterized Tic20 family protein
MRRMNASSPRQSISKDERDWAAASHALFGLCLITSAFVRQWGWGVMLLSMLGTGWLAWKASDSRPFALRHVRESFNLQMTFMLVSFGAMVAFALPGLHSVAGLLVVTAVAELGAFAQTWIASYRAAKGIDYRMPFAIRLLR